MNEQNDSLAQDERAWLEVDEDDPEVVIAARAIAENGFGRSWDDFLPTNAHDIDQSDLTEWARAAVAGLRAAAPRTPAGDDDLSRAQLQHLNGAYEQTIEQLRAQVAELQSLQVTEQTCLDKLKQERDQALSQVEKLKPCAKFVVWAMNDGPWQGGDIDGGAAQDKAVELGLIVETKYDPAKHKASDWVAPEEGEPWFVLDPDIVSVTSTVGGHVPQCSADTEDQCEYCGKVGGHNEICVMNEVIRLRDAVRSVLKTFRADEAAGYRSRDRQYAITILGSAAEDFPAPLHDKSQLSPLAAAIYSADGLYLSPLDAEKVAQIALSFHEAPQQSDAGEAK